MKKLIHLTNVNTERQTAGVLEVIVAAPVRGRPFSDILKVKAVVEEDSLYRLDSDTDFNSASFCLCRHYNKAHHARIENRSYEFR